MENRMSKLKYQCSVVIKTLVNDEGGEGVNVQTGYAYAGSKEEAEKIIEAMLAGAPADAVSKLGFYTKITVVSDTAVEES